MNTCQLTKLFTIKRTSLPNIKISGGKIDSRKVREGEIFLLTREIM